MWGKKEWQQCIFFSIYYQTPWGSRSEYFIILYHSCPISLQSLSYVLSSHIYTVETLLPLEQTTLQSMDSFSSGSIYALLYRTLIHRLQSKTTPKKLLKQYQHGLHMPKSFVQEWSQTEICFFFSNTGWKERRGRVTWLLSPKISQEWTLFLWCKKKNAKTLKAF